MSCRLGGEHAEPPSFLTTAETDLLGIKTKLRSLGTEVSEAEASSALWAVLVAGLLSMQLCARCCSGAFPGFSSQQPGEAGDEEMGALRNPVMCS